jgi:hypothetical protein
MISRVRHLSALLDVSGTVVIMVHHCKVSLVGAQPA